MSQITAKSTKRHAQERLRSAFSMLASTQPDKSLSTHDEKNFGSLATQSVLGED